MEENVFCAECSLVWKVSLATFLKLHAYFLKEIPLHVFLWGCCPQTLFRKISAMWPVASCQSRNVQPIQKLFILSQPRHIFVFFGQVGILNLLSI